MEVYPISIPQIDWQTYIHTFQDAFGRSPASGIDGAGMDNTIPASFVATLEFEKLTSPMDVLRNAARNMILYHSFCSFIYVGDREILTSLPVQILHVKYRRIKRDCFFAIISGNIDCWRKAVICGANGDLQENQETREFIARIYTYLVQAGFKEIWCNYHTLRCNDGTIIME